MYYSLIVNVNKNVYCINTIVIDTVLLLLTFSKLAYSARYKNFTIIK
jgi:hypothetical protein